MKKKYLLLAVILFLNCPKLIGQLGNNGILYTKFSPDTVFIYDDEGLVLDFDQSGTPEIIMKFDDGKYPWPWVVFLDGTGAWSWNKRVDNKLDDPQLDTLSNLTYNRDIRYCWLPDHYQHQDTVMYGYLKYNDGESDYYGWFLAIQSWPRWRWMAVREMAFCTIPNYPLLWGQKIIGSMDEKDDNNFAVVYPNPTSGQFTVSSIGPNLQHIEVVNMLGQVVLTKDYRQNDNNRQNFDICRQPSGVYFIAITDEKGHRCVRKVVKE